MFLTSLLPNMTRVSVDFFVLAVGCFFYRYEKHFNSLYERSSLILKCLCDVNVSGFLREDYWRNTW